MTFHAKKLINKIIIFSKRKVLSVTFYSEFLFSLVNQELTVGNVIGPVRLDIIKPPLQIDIDKLQKKLRLPATAGFKDYSLDLRKELDLERSLFLHRLVFP